MDQRQAPWRALLREERRRQLREDVRPRQASRAHSTPSPGVDTPAGRSDRRNRPRGRKHGWKFVRRAVRVAGPITATDDDLEDAKGPPGRYYDDGDEMFARCEPGCGCEGDPWWWVPLTPEHLFYASGLIHIAFPGSDSAYCGTYVWHRHSPESTDHANHIVAQRRARYTMATCLECIVGSWVYVG